jgi:hypothetical protein
MSASMRWFVLPLLLVALSASPAGASAACKNLRVPDHVRTALKKAHGHRDGAISKGSIYYGRCGHTHYAIASFSKALADQPEKFIRRRGHAWKDKGDGFENGCSAGARHPIPKALVKLWHICPYF